MTIKRSTSKRDRRMAYHEAGHAVVARRLGVSVVYVTMFPDRFRQPVSRPNAVRILPCPRAFPS